MPKPFGHGPKRYRAREDRTRRAHTTLTNRPDRHRRRAPRPQGVSGSRRLFGRPGYYVDMFSSLVDTPMYIVTCEAEGERSGCLVGFATQCSLRPVRHLVCLSIANHTFGVASRSSVLGVHLLSEEHRGLASLFGEQTGDMVDKFRSVAWHRGQAGAPILDDCAIYFEGSILAKLPLGDHVGFLLEPTGSVSEPDHLEGGLLTLHDVEAFRAGHPVGEGR